MPNMVGSRTMSAEKVLPTPSVLSDVRQAELVPGNTVLGLIFQVTNYTTWSELYTSQVTIVTKQGQ
jgi:hypothetical protein